MGQSKTTLYMFPTSQDGRNNSKWIGCVTHPAHGRLDASGSSCDDVFKSLASKLFEKILEGEWPPDNQPVELHPHLDKLVETQRCKLDIIQSSWRVL